MMPGDDSEQALDTNAPNGDDTNGDTNGGTPPRRHTGGTVGAVEGHRPTYRGGRPAGTLTQKTKTRLNELHRRMVIGQTDAEIVEAMGLSRKEYRNLLTRHYEQGQAINNGQFLAQYQGRKAFQYQQLVRTMDAAKGVAHPKAGQPKAPNSDAVFPLWLEKPQLGIQVACVAGMAKLDNDLRDTAFRLGVLYEAPTRMDITVRDPGQLTDDELDREEQQAAHAVAESFGVDAGQVLRLLRSGATPEDLAAQLTQAGQASSRGNGHGGNGQSKALALPAVLVGDDD